MENKWYDIDPFCEEEWEYEDEVDEDEFDISITDNPGINFIGGYTGVSGTSGVSNERIEEYFFGIKPKIVKNRFNNEKIIKINYNNNKHKLLNRFRSRKYC
jgi:hypothetical protein